MWFNKSADVEAQGLIASAALVVLLYETQALILYRIQNERHARALYALIVAATFPICWGVSPCWHHPQCYPIATFLGWPLTIHVVPLCSFHRGLELRRTGRLRRWWVESLFHLLIGVPVWYVVWAYIQLFCLGFIWL